MFKFLFNKTFLFHLAAALSSIVVLFLLVIFFIQNYTVHGQTITVPDLTGKSINEVKKILDNKNLEYKIVDSSFNDKFLPLSVLDQNPKADHKVKDGRTIYLTINSRQAPKIKMPDLKDVSLKQAGVLLNSYGLKVGRLIYKPDLAQNAVLDQMINGKSIKPGDFVSKGSTVDLVLGDGVGLADIEVPVLVGLTLAEAKFVLDGVGLNLGAVVADHTVSSDSLSAYIFRQIPDPSTLNNMIKPGEPVDVFISNDQSKVPRQ